MHRTGSSSLLHCGRKREAKANPLFVPGALRCDFRLAMGPVLMEVEEEGGE